MNVAAFKTGMLYDAANARAVAKGLKDFYTQPGRLPPLVVDPVCVSTSGHTLLEPDAVSVMIEELFPLATLITPNKAEAELLLSQSSSTNEKREVGSIGDALDIARSLGELSKCDVLLKGGHLTVTARDMNALAFSDKSNSKIRIAWDGSGQNMEILKTKASNADAPLVIDVLYERDSATSTVLAHPRIESTSTHGTGCTLSAAIACYLARKKTGSSPFRSTLESC